MENGVNCDGKSWKSHGILISVFCGNPVYNVKSRHDSSIYRDTCPATRSRIATLGNNFDLKKKKFAAGLGHALPKIMCLLAVRRGIDAKARSR